MEEKKDERGHGSFWSISGFWSSFYAVFRKYTSLATYKNLILNYLSTLTSQLSSRKGFTLIEIITTIGVLGILATIAFTAINPLEQYRKAQDSRRKSDLAQIQRALETYYQDFGHYPPSTDAHKIITDQGEVKEWGSSWKPYLDILPIDPNSNKFYVYWSDSDSGFQSYRLYTSLDRGGRDEDACNDGYACESIPDVICEDPDGNCPESCGNSNAICNYGVSSPNVSP